MTISTRSGPIRLCTDPIANFIIGQNFVIYNELKTLLTSSVLNEKQSRPTKLKRRKSLLIINGRIFWLSNMFLSVKMILNNFLASDVFWMIGTKKNADDFFSSKKNRLKCLDKCDVKILFYYLLYFFRPATSKDLYI